MKKEVYTGEVDSFMHFLCDDGRVFPIHPNYASKSKLLPGDKMRLYLEDGRMLYKVIGLVRRRTEIATVVAEGKPVSMLFARSDSGKFAFSVATKTFFSIVEGDSLIIDVPVGAIDGYCCVQGKITRQKTSMNLEEKIAIAEKESNDIEKIEKEKRSYDEPYIITRFKEDSTEETKLWAASLEEARCIALDLYGIVVTKTEEL